MIGIISCTKGKYKLNNVPARELYWKSTLFRVSYTVLRRFYPEMDIYILSAKYGLIKDTDKISYYNQSFKDMKKKDLPKIEPPDDYVFIGGSIYKSVLTKSPSKEFGEGLPLGKKVSYLKSLL